RRRQRGLAVGVPGQRGGQRSGRAQELRVRAEDQRRAAAARQRGGDQQEPGEGARSGHDFDRRRRNARGRSAPSASSSLGAAAPARANSTRRSSPPNSASTWRQA